MTKQHNDDRMIKRCRICGDKAFGFNFNGLSCESCKAFFRRHAHRIERLICINENKCKIDYENRRFCKRCRLEKCFAIGMDKELLLNKRKNKSSQKLENSNKPAKIIEETNLFQSQNYSLISSNSILNIYEQNCLEIIKKLPKIFNEKPRNVPKIVGFAQHLGQVFSAQEFFVKGFIEFGHLLTPFHNLSSHDQLIVLKQSFPEIMMLRSGFYYVFEKDAFLCRVDEYCNEAVFVDLKHFYGEKMPHLVEKHRKMAKLIREQLEFDTMIRDFISLLLMFKAKDNLSNPEYLRYNYYKYCHLLKNYLKLKHQDSEKAAFSYAKMLKIIDQIGPLKMAFYEIFNLLDTCSVSQTLMEIYGMC